MNTTRLQEIINQGEGTQVEFKKASIDLNKDAFDSVCGFLNRSA
jgi:ATP-dependent DNA helicase RecG